MYYTCVRGLHPEHFYLVCVVKAKKNNFFLDNNRNVTGISPAEFTSKAIS